MAPLRTTFRGGDRGATPDDYAQVVVKHQDSPFEAAERAAAAEAARAAASAAAAAEEAAARAAEAMAAEAEEEARAWVPAPPVDMEAIASKAAEEEELAARTRALLDELQPPPAPDDEDNAPLVTPKDPPEQPQQ